MLRNFLKKFQDIMFIEKISMEEAFLQKIDPRIKLFAFTFLIITTIFSNSIISLFPLLIVLILFSFSSNISFKFFFLRTCIFIPIFAAIISLPLPFITPGSILASFNLNGFFIIITLNGIIKAINFVFKIWICVATLTLLILTTSFSKIINALQSFKLPKLFILMIALTYRFIFLFIDEAYRMILAKEARTIKKQKKIEIMKNIGSIISNLFIRAYERGERVYLAMKSRGYSKDSSLKIEVGTHENDWIFLFVIIISCFISLYITFLSIGGIS
jgi:cobalt/nickel transport system permease protein